MALAEITPQAPPEPQLERPPVAEHIAGMRIPAHVELQDHGTPLGDNVYFLDDHRPVSPASPAYNRVPGRGVESMPTSASLGIDATPRSGEAKHMRPKVSLWKRIGSFVTRARGRVDAIQNAPSSDYQGLANNDSYAEIFTSPAQPAAEVEQPHLVAVPDLPAEEAPVTVAAPEVPRPVLTVVPDAEQPAPPVVGPDANRSAMFAAWKSGSRAGRAAAAAMPKSVVSEAANTRTITSPRVFTKGWQDDAADAIRKNNAFDPNAPLPKRRSRA